MSYEIRFVVPAFFTPFSNEHLTRTLRLTEFQERVHRALCGGKSVLLTAPTGSGKTMTLLLNTEHGERNLRGFVALYPNNTLLKNQLCTVEDVLVEHFNAQMVYSSNLTGKDVSGYTRRPECLVPGSDGAVEPLTVYRVDTSSVTEPFKSHYEYVALLTLSGKYILGADGFPKREVLYHLAEKIMEYTRKGSLYLIVFATPDTFLLIYTGAYRDFETVGKAVHNMLLALASGKPPESLEDILRKTGTLARESATRIVGVAYRLFQLPLFVDEFHLYGIYELDALEPLLRLHKEISGMPVVFSSATPATESLREVGASNLEEIKATLNENGDGFPVKGNTVFRVVPVPTRRRGIPAYYEAVNTVPDFVERSLRDRLLRIGDGRALILLDRLWMVSHLARRLSKSDVQVDCIASIVPSDVCRPGSSVIVASESATQGVNLGKVVLGIMSGVSAEDVVQRIGRVGRKGVDSEVYLLVPRYAVDANPPKSTMSYYEMVDWVNSVFPSYPKRSRDTSKIIPKTVHEVRRNIIYSLSIVSLARVSGMKSLLRRVSLSRNDATFALRTVVGNPSILAKLLLFRKTGYIATYVVDGTGERDESNLGLITRNFEVVRVGKNGELVIRLNQARQTLRINSRLTPNHLEGKIVELGELLRLINGRIEISGKASISPDKVGECAVFITRADEDLIEYLSYTGEGAPITSASGSKYVAIFI